MKIERFEDLECWQRARKLMSLVYGLIGDGSFKGKLWLADQMGKAALSVMNNIVEGFDSQSNAEFIKFLGYARRSASEVQTCLYAATDGGLITKAQFNEAYEQAKNTRQVIDGFLRYLREHRQRAQPTQRTQRAQPANA